MKAKMEALEEQIVLATGTAKYAIVKSGTKIEAPKPPMFKRACDAQSRELF